MHSPDPSRRPIDVGALRAAVDQQFFVDIDVSAGTGSTNVDVAALARQGAPEGTVRAADHQRSGRGRLARSWTSPPGAGIAVSVLLRPSRVPRERWPWLPLLAGVAVARVVARAGLGATLKWPNDVLVGDGKVAGILVEVVGSGGANAVVVGIGLNVTSESSELPPGATSLAVVGATELDRVRLLADLLGELARAYAAWCATGGDPTSVRAAYLEVCSTISRVVSVELPDGRTVRGTARTIDSAGRLVVETTEGELALGAGDVVHVRPAED